MFIQDKPNKRTNTNHLQYALICSDASGIHKGKRHLQTMDLSPSWNIFTYDMNKIDYSSSSFTFDTKSSTDIGFLIISGFSSFSAGTAAFTFSS